MGTETNTLNRLKSRIASGLAAGLMAVTVIVSALGMACGTMVTAHAAETLEICEVELTNTADGVELTWNLIEGADSYEIYRQTKDGDFNQIAVADATKTSFVDETVVKGTRYTYYVQPVSEDRTWGYENAATTYGYSETAIAMAEKENILFPIILVLSVIAAIAGAIVGGYRFNFVTVAVFAGLALIADLLVFGVWTIIIYALMYTG